MNIFFPYISAHINQVTQSSSTGLHIIQEDIATIGIIQNTQLEQTRNINSELLVIQTLTKDTHNNITSEQDLVMNRFAMIREASEQLGQTILDANDHMHDLKFALTALSSFSNLVTYLKWTTVVLAMAFFNRKVAIYLALAICKLPFLSTKKSTELITQVIIQELSAYFRGIKLDPLYAILESLYNSNNLQRNFRLIGIVALTWYLIYTRRSKLKSTSIPSSSERNWKTNTQRYNYYLPPPPYLPSLPFHTMQQAGYISPSHYRGPKSKKFEREQSAPL